VTGVDALADLVARDRRLVRLPALVAGRWREPPALDPVLLHEAVEAARQPVEHRGWGPADDGAGDEWYELDDLWVVRQPVIGDDCRGGPQVRYLVTPALTGEELLATVAAPRLEALSACSVGELLDVVAAVRAHVRVHAADAARVLGALGAGPGDVAGTARAEAEAVIGLLDPAALGEEIDRGLHVGGWPGRALLDGWRPLDVAVERGFTAQLDARADGALPPAGHAPAVRALGTRQLHITSANAFVVPLVSLLRAWATKGATILKSPVRNAGVGAVVAAALTDVAPAHALTEATSLVTWRGGSEAVEGPLLAADALDRVVVWGDGTTVADIRRRAAATEVVAFGPKVSFSVIGREAADLAAVARLAAIDALVHDQAACTASLVHYVEGGAARAERHARELQAQLARWDRLRPHRMAEAAHHQHLRLRRGELAVGRWFLNADASGRTTSAVVVAPHAVDLRAHPMHRVVVVRPVADAAEVIRFCHSGVSAVGVHPETLRLRLRDALAVRGVSSVVPLGEAERSFAAMPHDGAHVLNRLVRWATA